MKVSFKHAIMAFAALTMGLTSCSNDDDVTVDQGAETFMKLNIQFPKSLETRAAHDVNATDDEVKLSTINVFIFDPATSGLLSAVALGSSDFTYDNTSSDKYTKNASATIPTSTGAKKIYVGMNLPSSFPTISTIGDLKAAWTTTATDLVHATNGIAMFCTAEENPTLVEKTDAGYATANTVNFTMKRMVAKVAVTAGATLNLATTDNAGTIANVEFSIGQSNTKMFPYQLVESSVVKDPNWNTYAAGDFESFTAAGDYVAMNANGTAITSLAVKYAAENTAQSLLQKEHTYVSIQCDFIPDYFCDAAGAPTANTAGTAVSFWVVSLTNGSKYYFNNSADANTYAGTQTGSAVSAEYVGGKCYYAIFLGENHGYNVERNDFYQCAITKIIAPGSAAPTVKDPDQPIAVPTEIEMVLTIEPWDYYSTSHELI
ncbi:Mfa1 family fimbria major subunit [Bacteroides sp. 51]|uniref:Mfa1 family fimbria major subunit n=1 Tax=Bacteroides sp. 51 TaxID=2302938 RepID=UPI0013D2CDC9|nr:Mfa1 family fimbria major subunit [Bacteroides sp. 51]NDV82362.1 hypothetical protein [Bacteroides sp. 51]